MRAPFSAIAAALLTSASIVAAAQSPGQPAGTPATPAVEVEVDPNAAFARYRTFGWIPDLQPLKNATNHRLLVSAIERRLIAKGLTKAAPGQPPDLFVSFYAHAEGKLKGESVERSAATRDPSTQSIVTTFERERLGTLAVELLDGISRNMVWRAKGTQMLGSKTETGEMIDGYVGRLLADYPPAPPRS